MKIYRLLICFSMIGGLEACEKCLEDMEFAMKYLNDQKEFLDEKWKTFVDAEMLGLNIGIKIYDFHHQEVK